MKDYQWELGGVQFGVSCRIGHEADADPGSYSWRTQDSSNPVSDGGSMGRDLIDPQTWAFRLFTDEVNDKTALDALDEIASVWRGEGVRSTPGAVMPLRYRLGGRERRVYGRPRRFAAPLDNRLASGYIAITADFKCVSELYFDDVEESQEFDTRSAEARGGFDAPFDAPIALGGGEAEVQVRTVSIGGRIATPIEIDFHGPSEDASLEVAGQTFRVRGEIPLNRTVTFSGLPWALQATWEDGSGAGNRVHPMTRLTRLALPPGDHEGVYRAGDDTSGASTATVRWRNAHTSV